MSGSADYKMLLDKYLTNAISAEELLQLGAAIRNGELDLELELGMKELWDGSNENAGKEWLREVLYARIRDRKKEAPATLSAGPLRFIRERWFRYSAAALVILIFGAYLWVNYSSHASEEMPLSYISAPEKFLPGGNKAVLTLGNGQTLILDNAGNGQLARQGGVTITKTEDGKIIYKASGTTGPPVYNTMSTPRGGQYQLILPDGSRVWLNAASSITYPTVFSGTERRVSVKGEAYFEVMQTARPPVGGKRPATASPAGADKMPFIVQFNTPTGEGVEVKVTGTHFDINAYEDEAGIQATLLEGAIIITKDDYSKKLFPGQQVRVGTNGSLTLSENVDLIQVMAWKNGQFMFNDSDLRSVMREIARWYDLEVLYAPGVQPRKFTGKISRKENADQIFEMLNYAGVQFRIEGRKVTVLP